MAAMLAGFKEATGDAVINISADLQDPVELIPQMVAMWEGGAETVICHRTDRADSLSAKLLSRFAYGVLRMSWPQIPRGRRSHARGSRALLGGHLYAACCRRLWKGSRTDQVFWS